MKLEIDIPSIIYNDAKENRCYISVDKMGIAWKAIANGKPLEQEPVFDKLRAEIANHCGVNTDYCDSCRFCTDSMEVREILQIIDKYKGEK